MIKDHEASIQKATKVVDASTLSCKKATDEVATLISDSKVLLESLQATAETNTNKVDATIESLSKSLLVEKDKFDLVRKSLQTDHSTLKTSINSHLDKLQADLATENKIMAELVRNTTIVKT